MAKSAKDRGELIEKLKGCYKCTSWKHLGDQCFIKKNCTDKTGGTTCAGAHHKLLHGSGVAFCHKVRVVANSSEVAESGTHIARYDTDYPPDMTQPVLLEVQSVKVHGHRATVMFDNGGTAVLITHAFAKRARLQGTMVTYWLVVVGHKRVLRSTSLYTFHIVDNMGKRHEVQGYGIDASSEDSILLDLEGLRTIFPGAPRDVYNRPDGPIDILVGSMYRNLQPFVGGEEFTQGRLRLVRSHFGCGFILTGTHPLITARENVVTYYAKTLANCVLAADGDLPVVPVMTCNRAVETLKIPEFFEAEELGVSPAKACKKCRDVRTAPLGDL